MTRVPKKLPYLPLYTGDWRKDIKLTACTPATRGVWIDLLCAMHDEDRTGELRGTAEWFAILARCSASEVVQALTELQTKGAADVARERNGTWFVCNRRMRKECERRKANADRQMRHRESARNAHNKDPVTPFTENEIDIAFETFWSEFPKGRKHSKGPAREAFLKAICKAEPEVIIAAAREYAVSDVGRVGRWVKMPSTWLNQECWNDDREAWRDKDTANCQPAFREVSAEEFRKLFIAGKFKKKPTRHATKMAWVFGELRDGTKVECKDYTLDGGDAT